MNYYWIRQDKDFDYTPVIDNFYSLFDRRNFTKQKSFLIEERNIVFASSEYSQNYIDVLNSQLFLVSDTVKEVFQLYDNSIDYKFFCILNNNLDQYCNYYAPIFHDVDAFSSASEMNLNKSYIKKLVLNTKKIEDFSIFKLTNILTEVVIVRLDVVESLLRRDIRGVQFIKADLE